DPQIGLQSFGNQDAPIRLLIVLEEAGDRAREREARSVQGVNEPRLITLGGSEANVGAARLEIGEVAARGHLEPGADARRPRLEIVGHRRREAGVAGSEELAAVWNAQALERGLGMARQYLELFGRIV